MLIFAFRAVIIGLVSEIDDGDFAIRFRRDGAPIVSDARVDTGAGLASVYNGRRILPLHSAVYCHYGRATRRREVKRLYIMRYHESGNMSSRRHEPMRAVLKAYEMLRRMIWHYAFMTMRAARRAPANASTASPLTISIV